MTFQEEYELIKKILDDNMKFSFIFKGKSMEPTLISGDVIEVMQCSNISIGKIYVYYESFPTERFVCHRLIGIKNLLLYFKGDNRRVIDRPILFSDIIGEVCNVLKSM